MVYLWGRVRRSLKSTLQKCNLSSWLRGPSQPTGVGLSESHDLPSSRSITTLFAKQIELTIPKMWEKMMEILFLVAAETRSSHCESGGKPGETPTSRKEQRRDSTWSYEIQTQKKKHSGGRRVQSLDHCSNRQEVRTTSQFLPPEELDFL